ncbi:MAG: hypothetical protein H0X39_19280, partial [Actinobacteria bacterium]|nr:hypothetical protein [Actinomycetota bacterium]
RRLDVELARRALRGLGDELGVDAEGAAAAMYRLVTAEMANAVRAVTVERGHDPRRFSLVAFGGALGIFAAHIAKTLGIPRVVVPAQAPVFSAFGLLGTDDIRVGVRSIVWVGGDASHVDAAYRALESEAVDALRAAGYANDRISVEWQGDFKFAGQLWELTLPIASTDKLTTDDLESLRDQFPARYEAEYGLGTAWEGTPVMLLAARVIARGTADRLEVEAARVELDVICTPSAARTIILPVEGTSVEAMVYDGVALVPGARIAGPAIVDETLTTILVPPGWELEVDGYRNLTLHDRMQSQIHDDRLQEVGA